MHASWQSHKGLINNRPSWRQWASLGLMQSLWFGFGLHGLWRVKESHLFWCAFFSHVSDMHALSRFLRASFSLNVCSVLSDQWRLKWRQPPVKPIWQHFKSWAYFYWFLIRCYHSQASLRQNQIFNHCDIAITLQTDVAEQTRRETRHFHWFTLCCDFITCKVSVRSVLECELKH